MLPKANTGYFTLGYNMTVTAGWNIWANPGVTSPLVDSYAGSSVSVVLDSAIALALSGAAASIALLAF